MHFNGEITEKNINDLYYRYRYYASTAILFTIYYLSFGITLILTIVMQKTDVTFPQIFYDIKDFIILLIHIAGIKVGNAIFRLFNYFLYKINGKLRLYIIGENGKTWCILIICLTSIFLSFKHQWMSDMRPVAISIIVGRFFWVDNKRNNTIRIIKSFFDLPQEIALMYIEISYLIFANCVLNIPFFSTVICTVCGHIFLSLFSCYKELEIIYQYSR